MLFQVICAVAITILVHLFSMAACARATGVPVRAITLGLGPRILNLGWFSLAMLPLGGSVRLATLSDFPVDSPHPSAFELQPAWKRVLLPLSGPLALTGLGGVVLGPAAVDAFQDGFAEILGGAIDPFNRAQVLLQAASDRLAGASLMAAIGLIACKFAAYNLVPYVGSNGLQAILGLFPLGIKENKWTSRLLSLLALPLALLVMGGWLLAILVLLWSSL